MGVTAVLVTGLRDAMSILLGGLFVTFLLFSFFLKKYNDHIGWAKQMTEIIDTVVTSPSFNHIGGLYSGV